MSKLSAEFSATLARMARDVLDQRAARAGHDGPPKVNIEGAVRDAYAELARLTGTSLTRDRKRADRRRAQADRRLLHRVYHDWKDGWRFQERVARRLMAVLVGLDRRVGRAIRRLETSEQAERHALAVLTNPHWIDPATPREFASLLLTTEERHALRARDAREGRAARLAPVLRSAQALPAVLDDPRAARLVRRFRAWAEARGHARWLIEACLRRALGPLTGYSRTAGIVRGWDELSETERLRFLKASMDREQIILGPEPAHRRATRREATGQPPLPPLPRLPTTRAELRRWLANGRWKRSFPGTRRD